jgi:hypothetical protein
MVNEEGSIVNSDLLASKSLDEGMTFITPKVPTPISPNGALPSATFQVGQLLLPIQTLSVDDQKLPLCLICQ